MTVLFNDIFYSVGNSHPCMVAKEVERLVSGFRGVGRRQHLIDYANKQCKSGARVAYDEGQDHLR